MIFKLKKNTDIPDIYQTIVDRSRCKIFYLDYNVNDDFESRFDLVIIHSFTIFQYFINSDQSKSKLPQDIFDYMFNDFENNLREMGFGDIGVNTRMKKFISAFYGRILSYGKAYDEYQLTGMVDEMTKSIKKNIYKNRKIEKRKLENFAMYIIKNISIFSENDLKYNITSAFKFNHNIEV